MNEEALRYPIGKFKRKDTYSPAEISNLIDQIRSLPDRLDEQIHQLDDAKLDTPYRDGGWTIRQVVHHLADSHMNAYIRVKWALTESSPIIKAYDEKAWAETPETKLSPLISIALLKALHFKWTELLKRLVTADQAKDFTHPETNKKVSIETMIALYAWHGEHHLAHIVGLKGRQGWK